MKSCRNTVIGIVAALAVTPLFAQEDAEALRRSEAAVVEEARQLEEANRALAAEAAEMARLMEAKDEEAAVRLREAERRMAAAAQQVAELSMRQLPHIERIERVFRADRGPVLGITIGTTGNEGPVEGVAVMGVTPGGAAAEAGLRAGDVITSINGESLTADNGEQATERLLDFMKGVENGDELDVLYLRNGKSMSAAVKARPIEGNIYAFGFNGDDFTGPNFDVHVAPGVRRFENFVWAMHEDGFGDMEMVALTERLGSYFGTDAGLLVVRAPANDELKLEDGDVILNIDGREPKSVAHAVRILGSYQAGEELTIEIMRDRKKRKIEIVMPEMQSSFAAPVIAPKPVAAPAPPHIAIAPVGERIR